MNTLEFNLIQFYKELLKILKKSIFEIILWKLNGQTLTFYTINVKFKEVNTHLLGIFKLISLIRLIYN